MKELRTRIKERKDLHTFRARVAKFRSVGVKDIMLLLDVRIFDPESNTWKEYRDHTWVDANVIKDRSIQGNEILFLGKEYEYGHLTKQIRKGIHIKYPDLIRKVNNKIGVKDELF